MGKAPTISAGPASGNDFFSVTEDQATAVGGLIFNVLANDAKKAALYSLDNATVADLLQEDAPVAGELSALGNLVGITSDGKVNYSTGLNNSLIQGLAAGESVTDSFLYATRQPNGSLLWQTAQVTITGVNDAPVARVDSGLAFEDSITTGSVALNDSDVDHNAVLHFAATGNLPAGFAMASNGSWSFDASDPSYQALGAGQSVNLAVAYTVTDEHGASSNSTLVLTLSGTNDAPIATAGVAAASEGGSISGTLTALASDVDHGAALNFSAGELPPGFSLSADGLWSFDAGHPAYNGVDAGQSMDVVVGYHVADGQGGGADSTLTITVTGTNDAPVAIGQAVSATIALYPATTTLTGQVVATDADAGAHLTYAIQGFVPDGFVMNPDGSWNWTLPLQEGIELNEGQVSAGQLNFVATDEQGASSTGVLQISLIGSNDAPIRDDAFATATEDSVISGTYHGVDPDLGAVLTYQLDPGSDPGFTLASNGSWQFDAGDPAYQSLGAGETRQVVAGILVTDEHGASVLSPLFVTVTGTNDAPVLTGTATALANGVEDTAYTVTQAKLLGGWSDPDGDGLVASGLSVANAGVTANADGSFTITPNANYSGPLSLNYSVGDGTSAAAASLSLGIDAVNDPARISGVSNGTVTENQYFNNAAVATATGNLNSIEPDNSADNDKWQAVSSATSSDHNYGTFTVTADGVWTYSLNNGNSTVDALATGQSLTDTFTLHTLDGTSQLVTMVINGRTDFQYVAPDISGADPNDFDALNSAGTQAAPVNQPTGTAGNDVRDGSDLADTIGGSQGTDTIYGHGGNDYLYGASSFPDPAYAEIGADILYGQAGNDQLDGGNGVDWIYGGSGNDTLYGDTGANGSISADRLYGGSGDDWIEGHNGDDVLIGGYGKDLLIGGGGSDTFLYLSVKDGGDAIIDYAAQFDRLDLSAIDANTNLAGDQAFGWGAGTPAANSVWMVQDASHMLLFADTDGDPTTAEFMLQIANLGFQSVTNPWAGFFM